MWKMGEGRAGDINEGIMRTTVTEKQLIKIYLEIQKILKLIEGIKPKY